MNKFIKNFVFCTLILFIGLSTTTAFAETPTKVFKTLPKIVGRFGYSDFVVDVQRIVSDDNKVAYCMDINEDYPKGETFNYKYSDTDPITKSIAHNGYPNRTAAELKVKTDDEAYFVTQVALWAYQEGYKLENIQCDKAYLQVAIKDLYTYSVNNPAAVDAYNYSIYENGNPKIQPVLIIEKPISQPDTVSPTEPEKPTNPEPNNNNNNNNNNGSATDNSSKKEPNIIPSADSAGVKK